METQEYLFLRGRSITATWKQLFETYQWIVSNDAEGVVCKRRRCSRDLTIVSRKDDVDDLQ